MHFNKVIVTLLFYYIIILCFLLDFCNVRIKSLVRLYINGFVVHRYLNAKIKYLGIYILVYIINALTLLYIIILYYIYYINTEMY